MKESLNDSQDRPEHRGEKPTKALTRKKGGVIGSAPARKTGARERWVFIGSHRLMNRRDKLGRQKLVSTDLPVQKRKKNSTRKKKKVKKEAKG